MAKRVSFLGWALMLGCLLILIVMSFRVSTGDIAASGLGVPLAQPTPAPVDEYIVLAWNDLGMHCYNRDFEHLAILPPANTLWVQVIKVGDPPQIITTGLTVTYEIVGNSFSVGKTNFWTYEQALYGVNLPDNVGLTGFGMSGEMHAMADHFVAEAIPLTEFLDNDYYSNPANPAPYPYMLAKIEVFDAATGVKLGGSMPTAPVSTEMHCEYCHDDNGQGNPQIATGQVELNVLTLHDAENADEYPPAYPDPLVDTTPIRCSKCHNSNALPLPGVAGIPQLSHAMHETHLEEGDGPVPYTREGCYFCHPGPQTQCQRGTMSVDFGMTCPDCHLPIELLSSTREPWLDEPRCDTAGCHPDVTYGSADAYPDGVLYRNASDHNGIYCEGCHDSPHAIAPSREPNDRIKFIALQNNPRALRTCTVCHLTEPVDAGVHGLMALSRHFFLPIIMR